MLQAATRPSGPASAGGAPTLPDRDLVERVRAGDVAAFELIMRRHNRRLFRLARSILRNSAEAEDVVQETYVRAYARLGEFVGPNGFPAWLGRIAVNEALGRVRGWGRVVSIDDYVGGADGHAEVQLIETMRTPYPDPERLAGNGELRHLLEGALDALPDDFRTVFVLRAVEGLSVAETAEMLSDRAGNREDALPSRTPLSAGHARRTLRRADAGHLRVRRRALRPHRRRRSRPASTPDREGAAPRPRLRARLNLLQQRL